MKFSAHWKMFRKFVMADMSCSTLPNPKTMRGWARKGSFANVARFRFSQNDIQSLNNDKLFGRKRISTNGTDHQLFVNILYVYMFVCLFVSFQNGLAFQSIIDVLYQFILCYIPIFVILFDCFVLFVYLQNLSLVFTLLHLSSFFLNSFLKRLIFITEKRHTCTPNIHQLQGDIKTTTTEPSFKMFFSIVSFSILSQYFLVCIVLINFSAG